MSLSKTSSSFLLFLLLPQPTTPLLLYYCELIFLLSNQMLTVPEPLTLCGATLTDRTRPTIEPNTRSLGRTS